MSESLWNCQIQELKEAFTVGSRKILSCRGSQPRQFVESIYISFKDPKKKYSLVILKNNSVGPNSLDAEVTSYKPGDYRNVSFELTDGITSILTNPMSWQVKSVLNPKEKPQAFGIHPAESLSWPLIYIIFLGLVFTCSAIASFFPLKRFLDRKRLLKEIEVFQKNSMSLSDDVYDQVSQSMRKIHRKYDSIAYMTSTQGQWATDFYKDLDNTFKVFIARKFLVPSHKWSSKDTLRDIRKRHKKVYLKVSLNLHKIFHELDPSQKQMATHSDCKQIFVMIQDIVAQIRMAEGD